MTPSSICTRSIAAAVVVSLAGFFSPSASAQTTATTVPVGFITKTIPAAGASPTSTVLSIPLYQTAAFQSAVAATPAGGSHAVTLASAAFTAGQFTATPHLLRVKTGALAGKFWIVLSHDATTLNLKEPNGGVPSVADANLTGLVVNDSCEVLPANTFGNTFGSIPGIQTAGSAAGADNILVWNGTSYVTYFQNLSNQWRTGLSNATNTIIFPDDAVFFVRKAASTLPVTIMGTVPSTVERTELIGASRSFVSNRFPVDLTLGTSGIENTPGWIKGGSAAGVDNVLLWNGTSFVTYFCNLSNQWRTGLSNATNVPIPAGSGMFIVRASGTTDAVLTQALPYVP